MSAMAVPAGDQQHPSWCARGPECGPSRDSDRPEHRSQPRTIAADPAVGADAEYRVTLMQSDDQPALIEVVAGLPDAFDETAAVHDLSLTQGRQLTAILAELAAEGSEDR